MWIEGNYRRNLLDMHIDDWNPEFLSKLNVEEYVKALKEAGMQTALIKAKPHTGLCYYPTKIGRMHKGLKGYDFLGAMIRACHENGIAAQVYFTQIFDNWAYEEHPEWRMVTADGKNMREYRKLPNFKTGRYGIVCPNNEEYREYVRDCLTEINTQYDFEGMFLDMTFWPEVCYCPSCRKKYKAEAGREIPRVIDWNNREWKEFAYRRDEWMAEYAKFATQCVKNIHPHVTIEHQFSRITGSWLDGCTEMLTEAADYSGGDYYGGFLQQSFINKYYKSVSPHLPFNYHTSRCDPELMYHTTTKTEEQLLLHVIMALVHNGSFMLVDAINPDGTIVPQVYHELMKKVFDHSRRYEKYVNGNLYHDVSIWFASHAKYDPYENNREIMDKEMEPGYYLEAPFAAASILREANIAFDVLGTKNIAEDTAGVMLLSHIANIREEEMDEIEKYLERGGNLLISGPIANRRLQDILGVKVTGYTEHDFTYMSPTDAGKKLFSGFTKEEPLTVDRQQIEIEIVRREGITVLATLTLPYTMTNTEDFAAIHSNPPGIYTDKPCAILKDTGKNKIIWTAAPLEMAKPYMSRQVFKRLVQKLIPAAGFISNAPKYVEIVRWEKEGLDYFAVINEQEDFPLSPVYEITIEVEDEGKRAYLLPEESEIPSEKVGEKMRRIFLPKLDVFLMFVLK